MSQTSCTSSAKHNAKDSTRLPPESFNKGQIVYVKIDESKSNMRDKYVIVDLHHTKELATIQKLLSKNPRKNLITVQYQNLYPAEIKHPAKPESIPQDNPKPSHS